MPKSDHFEPEESLYFQALKDALVDESMHDVSAEQYLEILETFLESELSVAIDCARATVEQAAKAKQTKPSKATKKK